MYKNDSSGINMLGTKKNPQQSGFPHRLMRGGLLILFILISSFTPLSAHAAGIQPNDVLQNGYVLFSCYAAAANEPALAIMDLTPAGALYSTPGNPADLELDVSGSFTKTTMWNLSEFGGSQIMGTTFDNRDGTIYVSTSGMYKDSNGPPASEVWRIAPSVGSAPVLLATLPGNQGTGWLDYDEDHDQIYVSNLDDGLIYVVEPSLGIGQTGGYATFSLSGADDINEDTTADQFLLGLPDLGERIWGVGYNEVDERLYYAVWVRDTIGTGSNSIRSVAINPNGTIDSASDRLEITQTNNTYGSLSSSKAFNMPVSDIAFSQDGTTMLLAEQSYTSLVSVSTPSGTSHNSRVLEYRGSSGNWTLSNNDDTKHKIGGTNNSESNSRGSVSFSYHSIDGTGLLVNYEGFIAASGDALIYDTKRASQDGDPRYFVYGIQYHPITGGSQDDSIKIDLDGRSSAGDKYLYGDIDVRMEHKDFGDLPDIYITTGVYTGAAHVLDGFTFLGTGVDPEGDGQPSDNADGDDANQDGVHTSDLPDDEDGIVFLDPLMPGKTARIQVEAGSDGFLNAFIDFDNDGTLDPVTINGAGTLVDLPLNAGTRVITIDVPATATGKQIYSRFRFTAEAGDPAAVTSVGTAATGEVEDYVLMSIGNRVWFDNGAGNADNGKFDGNEQPVSGVTVELYDSTNTLIATTTTDANGYYLFPGLNPSKYTVKVAPTNFQNGGPLENFLSTTGDGNDDALDSTDANSDNGMDDTDPAANGISSNEITLALGDEPIGEETSGSDDNTANSNLTVDFGFVQRDWGDLPDGNATDSPTYNTLDDGTPGPSHVIVPGLYLGTSIDDEIDGQPTGAADGDNSAGDTPDDEAGISLPAFTPGTAAAVSATVVNTTGLDATLYGFIDFDGDGLFTTPGETISKTTNGSGTVQLNFNVPSNADTTQQLGARFRLSTDSGLGADGPASDGEVEDYLITTLREEYGDLPDIYGTRNNGTVAIPAVHVITDTLRLGELMDSDDDGAPNVRADGDDLDDGIDDEDGITFLTPIMPGEPVEIQVSATISGGSSNTATVGAWIDLNGDGDFKDDDEYHRVDLTSDATGKATKIIRFTAPSTIDDTIYSRFRIAYDSTEVDEKDEHVGSASTGEVEDYVLMSLGNRVWLDNGPGNANDGAFDNNESGIGGVVVQLLDAAGAVITETTTAPDGTYLFTGLISDTYTVHLPKINFGPGQPLVAMSSSTDSGTTGNVDPDDDLDDEKADENGVDNANPAANGISSQPISLVYGDEPTSDGNGVNSNLTVDFGLVEYDWGDLPDGNASGSPSYNTLDGSTGPNHLIVPGLHIGNSVDAETDGQPDALAEGDDGTSPPDDDEDGVTFPAFYTGKDAAVDVTVSNTGTAAATLYGFIDFNGDGDFDDLGEIETAIVNPNDTAETLTFSVPITANTELLLGARFRLSTDGTLDSEDTAPDGEVEDYLISVFGLEYGDLPDIYGTRSNGTVAIPAVHIVTDTLKLGSIIDSDTDGAPNVKADGDDIDDGIDDEDGITFLTPIMPGEPVEIQVSATISGGSSNTATVGAWIDLNGDGDFKDDDEYHRVDLTSDATGKATKIIRFTAPSTIDDTIYSRFRIAYDSTEVDEEDEHVGSASTGEVEDYVLMSLGNFIWIDDGAGTGTANNGIVDGNEVLQGVEDVVLQLLDDQGNPIDGDLSTAAIEPITTTTNITGEYAFTGLISDTYKVQILPENFVDDGPLVGYASSAPETPGIDNRDNGVDPDDIADYLTDGISSAGVNLPFGEAPTDDTNGANSDFTVDFGFVPLYDYGDLPDNYSTEEGSTGAKHLLDPGLYLGAGVDAETDGVPGASTLGDDNSDSDSYQELLGDDEDGITFLTPFVAGETALITIEAGVDPGINGNGTAFYGAWIDLNGDGDFNDDDEYFTGPIATGTLTLTIPISTGVQISDTIYSRFRISADQNEVGQVNDFDDAASSGEVEDYVLMSLGNFVWIDDGAGGGAADNGIVDGNETTQGVEGVILQLLDDQGNPIDGDLSTPAIEPITTTTDANGEYAFTGLISDTYKVKVLPENFLTNGALVGYASSGPEDPDTDNRDNGLDPSALADYLTDGVSSGNVPLFNGGAPDAGDDGNSKNSDFTVDFGFVPLYDYGDLPDNYSTEESSTGAKHLLDPGLYLGAGVDAETDGLPGVSTLGDDSSDSDSHQGTLGDDEDGITFLTPFVAGETALITIEAGVDPAINGNGTAFYGAWIDLNGDGDFNDDDEYFTGSIGNETITLSIPISAGVQISDTIYTRFRIAADQDEVGQRDDFDDAASSGEVEDYVLMSLGNFVWIDDGAGGLAGKADDGIVNGTEATQGVEGVILQLLDDQGNPIDGDLSTPAIEPITTTTDANGEYAFTGLISDTYEVQILPENFLNDGALVGYASSAPETPGTDDRDNGIDPAALADYLTDGVSSGNVALFNGGAPDAGDDGNSKNSDFTVDFGFVPLYDYGDLPDNYSTEEGSTGAKHLLDPGLYLGAGVDAETDGLPGASTLDDDNSDSDSYQGILGDDEDGITFLTPFVAGETALITIEAGVDPAINGNGTAFYGAWIDLNGDGDFDDDDEYFTGSIGNETITLSIPISAGVQISDTIYTRFRIAADQNEVGQRDDFDDAASSGEVEDYVLMSLGNFVWIDDSAGGTGAADNGIVDGNETTQGVEGVVLQLFDDQGNPIDGDLSTPAIEPITTTTNITGEYVFTGLISDTYKVKILPENFLTNGALVGYASSGPENPVIDNRDNGMDPTKLADYLTDGVSSGNVPLFNGGAPDAGDDGNSKNSDFTVDFGFVPLYDFGDLPDNYSTLDASTGANHRLDPGLYFGAGVDAEDDGVNTVDALGDDNSDDQSYQDSLVDDEDGITFMTPIMPGEIAEISITAHVSPAVNAGTVNPGRAYYGAWLDLNGDGDFDDDDEYFTGSIGDETITLSIPISAGAQISDTIYTRFRIAADQDEVGQRDDFDDDASSGEVEDYVLMSLGNQVWLDDGAGGTANDGIFDAGEVGMAGVIVELYREGDTPGTSTPVATTTTDSDGEYLFTGLQPDKYVVHLPASNFGTGKLLEGLASTTDTTVGNVDPNNDLDDGTDENGIDDPTPSQNGITSLPVTLDYGMEPDATVDGSGVNSNLTVDFGLIYYDLALIKTRSPGQNYAVDFSNDPLIASYDIVVENQGPAAMVAATVLDTIPDGMSLISVGGAMVSPTVTGTHTLNIANLAAGASKTFRLVMRVDDLSFGIYKNIAEVSHMEDGNGMSVPDIDSTPDITTTNDAITTTAGIDPNDDDDENSHNALDHQGTDESAPGNIVQPTTDEDDHDQEVIVGGLAVGNRVWYDTNDSGTIDGTELGIEDVLVELYKADSSGNITGTLVSTDTTDANGYWLIDNLPPGDYIAVIPSSNFTSSGALMNMYSSTDIVDDSAEPNNDIESDDNGIDSTPGPFPGGSGIRSGVITLDPVEREPLQGGKEGDRGPSHGNAGDEFDNLTVDFGFIQYDLGDMPDSYGTTFAAPAGSGAAHVLDGVTFLGAGVDAETDGQHSVDANGDDMLTGIDTADDEDGVTFNTPIMANEVATIIVSASITGALNAWIDFNGNGTLETGEQIFTDEMLDPGNNVLTFTAPGTVDDDNLYSRFRFTDSAGKVTSPHGSVLTGEVEDYVLMSLGDTIWLDNGAGSPGGANANNGVQDGTESGIEDVVVELYAQGTTPGTDDPIATTTTDGDGKYLFTGLVPGDYSVYLPSSNFADGKPLEDHFSSDDPGGVAVDPDDNQNPDQDDNGKGDGYKNPRNDGIISIPVTLALGDEPGDGDDGDGKHSNRTVDFGLVQYDKGDLPDINVGTTVGDYETLTTLGHDGAMHVIVPDVYLGAGVDSEFDGQPHVDASGDDTSDGDDEDGVVFTSLLLPGENGTVDVNANVDGFLNAWIDFNGDGDFDDLGEQIAADTALTAGTNSLNFAVPDIALASDLYTRFRFTSDDPDGALDDMGKWDNGEVEDYVIHLFSLGNQVWHDLDDDGIMDTFEPALDGVLVNLIDPATGAVIMTDTTASGGYYLFDNLQGSGDHLASSGDYIVEIDSSNFVAGGPLEGMYNSTPTEADPDADGDINDNGINPASNQPPATSHQLPATSYQLPVSIRSGVVTLSDYDEPTLESELGPDGHGNAANDFSNLTVDFGFYLPVTVGDRVWYDHDKDGVQDTPADEPGVPGIDVTLYDSITGQPVLDGNGNPLTMTTDANGDYLFEELPPGRYHVQFDLADLPQNYIVTAPHVGTNISIDSNANPSFGTTDSTPFLYSNAKDLTLDLGIMLLEDVRVGDRVWYDDNKDGIQDAGEVGVEDVTVILYDNSTGQPFLDENGDPMTQVTDASGTYLFEELPPGDYYVQFDLSTLPLNYLVTTQDATNNQSPATSDQTDSDGDPTTGVTASTGQLNSTEEDLTLDLGIYRLDNVRVGDYVWYDDNRDGIQDADEDGVEDVLVTLYDTATRMPVLDDLGNAVTDVTNANGEYIFEELPPGDYYVVFDLATLPQNYTPTQQDATNDQPPTTSDQSDSDGDSVTGATAPTGQLNSNEEDLTLDLGIHRLDNVRVGDRVWYDHDKDGVQDPNENGVPGVSVTLYDATTGAPMTDGSGNPIVTATDGDGEYLFEDLPPGDYYVVFDLNTLPPNQTVTRPDVGSDSTDSDANPVTGQTGNTGHMNSNEEDLTLDMGIHQLDNVRVGDLVWYDDDRDGIQDPNEAGVPNVLAVLYDANTSQPVTDQFGVPMIDITDANGNYLFEYLPPGDYYVGFQLGTLPSGYVVTQPNQIDGNAPENSDAVDSDADGSTGVTGWTGPTGYLSSSQEDLTLDMGIYQPEGVRVGDKVWLDNDQDGIQDGNEPGVPGVTVNLIDSTGNPVTVDQNGDPIVPQVTDANGYYFFDNLPDGDYAVIFDLNTIPANHAVTQPDQGGDDLVDSDGDPTTGETPSTGPLVDGDEDLTLDLGIYPTSEVRVGDTVWYDNDNDGIQDADESGVEDVMVHLFNADGTQATDMIGNPVGPEVTDANGHYLFENLPADDYYVVFDLATLPNGYQPTMQDAANDQSPETSDQNDSDANPATGQTASTGPLSLGDEDLTLDMGIVAPVRIGDRVWYDHDRDGQQDASAVEPGVPDVTVNIFHADGTPVTTDMDGEPVVAQVTDADGEYLFENLAPGDYYVQFDLATLPVGSIVTEQDTTDDQSPTTSDQTDSDGDPATGMTASTGFLPANTEDLTLDLGIFQLAGVRVGDRVWYDNDKDGIQDGDEPGVEDITVRIFNADGTPAVDLDGNPVGPEVTDSDGNYLFDSLPEGDYYVVFDLTSLPDGYQPTVQDATDDQQDSDANPGTGQSTNTGFLPGGTADLTLDMGIYQAGTPTTPAEEPVRVGNRVWYDNDGDGLQDDPVEEPGVAGVTVTLFDGNGNSVTDLAGNLVGPEVTDGDGFYLFDNLPEGDYYVVFNLGTLPEDYVVTHANVVDDEQPEMTDALDSDGSRNTGRTPTTDKLTGGEEDMTLDLGIVKPVSVGDRVWLDEDDDGIQDDPSEEPGVADVTAMIFNADGTPVEDMDGKLVGPEVTDSDGGYLFDNLLPGDYYVQFDLDTLPDDYGPTKQDATDDQSPTTSDEDDSDANPVTGETDSTGFLPSGSVDPTLDLGIVPLGKVRVGDLVWYDDDRDGLQDPGEAGVEGVTVRLFNADGTPVTDSAGDPVGPEITDSDGNYLFDNLPVGDYYVQFDRTTLPAGYQVTAPNQGSDDGIDSDVSNAPNAMLQSANTGFLPANSEDLTLDMGIVKIEPVSIGNRVWIDSDRDGIQDDPADEPGVSGVTVRLFNADGTPAKDINGNPVGPEVTDGNGNYLFENLPSGEYYVQFDLNTIPDGHAVTTPNATNDQSPATSDKEDSDVNPGTGTTGAVTVPSGENLTLDMGLVKLVGVRVGDRVWLDMDRNGIQDPGETGIPGVTVTLYERLGADPVATTVTDSDGNYLFDKLPSGDYYVIFDLDTLPAHHVVTTQNSGDNDGVDSDVTADEGRSDTTRILFDGEEDMTLDMGVYPLGNVTVGDRVWYDLDKDGIQDEDETGVADVSVALHDATTGLLLATTTTDGQGNYLFQDLPPGDYYVDFDLDTLPMGYVPTVQNATNSQSPATSDQFDSDADPTTGQTDKTDVLFDGEEDLSLDMGIYRLPGVEVGSTVWFDDDSDGIQDVLEDGVPGVTVYLIDSVTGDPVLDEQGNPLSDVTDSQGKYLFTELPPGQYHVVFDLETIPDDYVVTDAVQIVGGSVADPTDGQTPPTNILINGQRDLTLNMGIWKPVQVGNRVWYDDNGNGIQDDEPGVAGVTVTLYNNATNAPVTDENGNPLTVVTDEAGNYLFDDLPPGDYYVAFDLGTLPDGYIVTHQDSSSEDSLDSDVDPTTAQTPATGFIPSGEQDLTLDMGIVRPVSVGNLVWLDSDNDGIQDEDEAGVPGIGVTLYDATTGEPVTDNAGNPLTDVTDGSGNYSFTDLLPGDYYVTFDLETLPEDHVITRPNATNDQQPATSDQMDSDVNPGTGQSSSTGFLTDGASNDTLDMGIYPVIKVVGENPEEEIPGEENPEEENPEEEIPGEENPEEETEETPVETAIRVGGTLWVEENPNGQVDEGEQVLAGVTVALYSVTDPDNPIATQVTDEDGYYLFDNLPEGEYYTMLVASTLPQGAILPPSVTDEGELLRTTTGLLIDDGEFLTMNMPVLFTSSLSGQVWLDQNGNGVRTDVEDTVLSDIPVRIYDEYGKLVAETVTDEMGNYVFPDLLPGLYQVEYVKPDNHGVSPDQANEGPEVTESSEPNTLITETVLVGSQEDVTDVDLGLYPGASVGNLVWEDLDGDGLFDEGETGLSDLVVQLIDAEGEVVAETTTDEDGYYGFTELLPGDYAVVVFRPDELVPGLQNELPLNSESDPTSVKTELFPVAPGESYTDVDVNFVQPSAIGNFVWLDTDKDGIYDDNEMGLAGVIVYLYDTQGNVVAQTQTDGEGRFEFIVPPGEYQLKFEIPAEMELTVRDGGDDTVDSDVDSETGMTPFTVLSPGETDHTFYAGLIVSPTAIQLMSLVATDSAHGVTIHWSTGTELSTFGYLIYRSRDGRYENAIEVTESMVLSTGDGANYHFVDSTAHKEQVYSYWLVEVQNDGQTYRYGPSQVITGQPLFLLYLPIMEQ